MYIYIHIYGNFKYFNRYSQRATRRKMCVFRNHSRPYVDFAHGINSRHKKPAMLLVWTQLQGVYARTRTQTTQVESHACVYPGAQGSALRPSSRPLAVTSWQHLLFFFFFFFACYHCLTCHICFLPPGGSAHTDAAVQLWRERQTETLGW